LDHNLFIASTLTAFYFKAFAEKYLSGEIELDPFIEQFLVTRKQMHLRRVKADKMSEILASSPTQGYPPPIPSRLPYPVHSAPYPVADIPGMPRPLF
jgi:ESCRT-I complex subunit VPS37